MVGRIDERADKGYDMQVYASMDFGAVRMEEAKVVELQTLLAQELRTLGHLESVTSLDSPLVAISLSELDINHDAAQELATLNQRASTPGVRFGIVAFAPSDVPDIWWPLEVF